MQDHKLKIQHHMLGRGRRIRGICVRLSKSRALGFLVNKNGEDKYLAGSPQRSMRNWVHPIKDSCSSHAVMRGTAGASYIPRHTKVGAMSSPCSP